MVLYRGVRISQENPVLSDDSLDGSQMKTIRVLGLPLIACCLLSACAVPVQQLKLDQPIILAAGKNFVLANDARCSIGTGYSRVLRLGTRWQLFGVLAQGEVYRSPDQTLTVEGYNVHEAYLVVKDSTLVGFYLPVEKTFTPVSKPVQLTITTPEEVKK